MQDGRGRTVIAQAGVPAIALVACLNWAPVAAGEGGCALPVTEMVRVAGAIDGDTIETEDGARVRLAAIEAPKALGFGDPAMAQAARAALDGLVAGASISLARVGAGPDRYGRVHAQGFLPDGRWLQAVLAEAGLVRIRPLEGETACVASLLAAEDSARAADRGIWKGKRHDPLNPDDPSLLARSGLYELVEGRVLSVGHGSYMIFLDFGPVYRRDFTVMIPPPVAERLAAAGFPADSLEGRSVRVRGVIEESGGPAIRIHDPVAIEVLDGG